MDFPSRSPTISGSARRVLVRTGGAWERAMQEAGENKLVAKSTCSSRAVLLALLLALSACRSSNGNFKIDDAGMALLLLPIVLPVALIAAADDEESEAEEVHATGAPVTGDGSSDAPAGPA